MTGDGVNDTLALKESNCAIAMADGSEVARKISQIVLLNSDFSTLPDVVREGRRCINNVRSSSVLYLMKTIFAILVSFVGIVTVSGYPFEPNMLFLLELLVIGFASVMLALEPNNKRIEGSYIQTVLIKSLPNALSMFIPVLALMIVEKTMSSVSLDCRNSIALWAVTSVGLLNLIFLCVPYTKWRTGVVSIITLLLGLIIPISMFALADPFNFKPAFEHPVVFFIVLSSSLLIGILIQFFRGRIESFMKKHFSDRSIFRLLGIERR